MYLDVDYPGTVEIFFKAFSKSKISSLASGRYEKGFEMLSIFIQESGENCPSLILIRSPITFTSALDTLVEPLKDRDFYLQF
jgi:hypothetical protein